MENKAVLITGASSGIGAAIAEHFAKIGYKKLSLVARRKAKLDEVAERCRKLGATDVITLSKDVTDAKACETAIAETADHFGRLDVLICNAGGGGDIATMPSFLRGMPDEVFHEVLNLNLVAPFIMTKHAMPHLEKTKGNVLFVSSVAATLAFEYTGPYCAAKAGLNALARCFALEEAAKGVRVNTLSPGMVVTPIHTMKSEKEEDFEKVRKGTKEMQPLGRCGEAVEMAYLAAFMVSDENAFMTGSDVASDGGLRMRLKMPSEEYFKEAFEKMAARAKK